ncbi:MAG: PAS domain-containing protein, partial [Promethearchaeota archaeon]
RILKAFKNGQKDSAEFWIKSNEKFIQIRYFAVRDNDKVYRGTLEVTQDVTSIRQLEGEQRLLNWED